jgi:hypothetical protein
VREKYTFLDFPAAFAELLSELQGKPVDKVDYRAVLNQVDGYTYEALRLMLKGRRTLKMEAIEGMAKAVGVSPHYFREYRDMWAAKMAKRHPKLGEMLYDIALHFVTLQEGRAQAGDDEGDEK